MKSLITGKRTPYFPERRELTILGFTLMEMIIVIALIGSLFGIAIPVYSNYRQKIRINKAVDDIKALETGIMKYFDENGRYPADLGQTGMGNLLDPWNNPYRYLWINGNPDPGMEGRRRRYRNNIPVNYEFDLYSMGPDGRTHKSFRNAYARDDIARAYDSEPGGPYYGPVYELDEL